MFLNKNSIFFKISLLFLFSLVSFFAFSFYFIKFQIDVEHKVSLVRYRQIASVIDEIIASTGNVTIVENFLKELGFGVNRDPRITDILRKYNPNQLNLSQGVSAATVQYSDNIYILLEKDGEVVVYRDNFTSIYESFYFVMIVGLVLLGVIFMIIVYSLLPLKNLIKTIRRFANGENVRCEVKQNDEVGLLAIEFNNAISKISALESARSLFLRSIMHELKTPIAKGRIVSEMLDDVNSKNRLISVFLRLQHLIEDFAKIEKLASKNLNPKKEEFELEYIIGEAKKILLLDLHSKEVLLENNGVLKVDFELFTLAIKNLLDNAIKYSSDGRVRVGIRGYNLEVKSKGEPLKYSLDEYTKPYFKNSSSNSKSGLGLGMYIIKNTLESQEFEFGYYHVAGINHFVIKNCIIYGAK